MTSRRLVGSPGPDRDTPLQVVAGSGGPSLTQPGWRALKLLRASGMSVREARALVETLSLRVGMGYVHRGRR